MKQRMISVWLIASLLSVFIFAKPVSAAAPTPDGATITVVDALGREVTLAGAPNRIVTAGKATWMIVHALYMFPGAHERFLAMEKRGNQTSEFLTALYPDFPTRPHLETEAGPEQIAPLKPDAIILKSYMKERLGDPLERLGFPVIYVDLETPEQYFRDMTTLGELMGNPERAAEIISFYQTRLDMAQNRLAPRPSADADSRHPERNGESSSPESDSPRVLVIQYNGRGQELAFDMPPAHWMQTIQVELAGGKPVWKDAPRGQGWQVVTFEQIAAWNPDHVFVIVFRSDPAPVMERIRAEAKWQVLKAARDHHLYAFPADFFGWDAPDPRWILGLMWAAQTIHPDRFADVDMTAEFYSFYEEMYGLTPQEITETILPHVTGDARVAHF